MKKLKVYYREEMVADSESFSPSAAKPEKVANNWLAKGLDIEIVSPQPVIASKIAFAHDPAYVHAVLTGKAMNGFGNHSPEVAKSLRFTVGAMVWATIYAMNHNEPAAALCSGFHHAGYASGGGFCTFNGLIIAAQHALKSGARRVGILDLDEHYGNGTDEIIKTLKLEKRIPHYTGGAHFSHNPDEAEPFLKALPELIKRKFYNCDVLIYQAGADPFIGDPLGGWMTMEQLARRDRIVFETCKMMALPVAWNLAGGYAKDEQGEITPVLKIHAQTAEACIAVYQDVRTSRGAA